VNQANPEKTIVKRTIHSCYFQSSGLVVAILLIAFFEAIHLESVPPFSWDEGWTLSVAQNWVERGFYGRLLMGEPVASGLEASVTVTGLVALTFRLLGVGLWQGRTVGLVCFTGALVFLYFLAARIYDRVVAKISIAVVFLGATIFPQLHPILSARQVLAEMPMLFFILGGYVAFYFVLSRSLWFMPLAVVLWAAGAITKGQAPPFLAVSLLLPLLVTILSAQWKVARIIVCGLVSTVVVAKAILWLQILIFRQYGWSRTGLPDIYGVVAFVPDLEIRWLALQVSAFLLPTILGLLYQTRKSLNLTTWTEVRSDVDILRITMLGFTGSWLIWYIFLSNAYPRYALPANFVGSMFAAELLRDLLDKRIEVFSGSLAKRSKKTKFLQGIVNPELLLALLFITVWPLSTLKMLYHVYSVEGDTSVKQVAQFLNTQTRSDAVVETYDSEVQFLLSRRYHFPPDQVHLDLIRRAMVGHKQRIAIDYDPLAANPDYLVVGDFIKGLRLYDPVIRSNAFRLIQSFNKYDIYERVR
jgi:hypothetical protein